MPLRQVPYYGIPQNEICLLYLDFEKVVEVPCLPMGYVGQQFIFDTSLVYIDVKLSMVFHREVLNLITCVF